MNRQQSHNDEELYQQFMTELDAGAAEYDRMMASGEAPAKKRQRTIIKLFAAAAAIAGMMMISTLWLTHHEDVTAPLTAHITPAPAVTKKNIVTTEIKPQKQIEKVPVTTEPRIYTAMLPEVVFCPEEEEVANVQLPDIRKERSFELTCKVVLPDITAYKDSAAFTNGCHLMVLCDEIDFNDSTHKNVAL